MTPPERLGRYRIVRELGRGAMGIVYQGVDEQQAEVAIKTLMLSDDASEQQGDEARFRQEARAGAQLRHPNVISILDAGREGPLLYIVMELLRGVELRSLMHGQALPLPVAVHLWAQVAAGVAAAHALGIVHRDIKPSNVMVLPGNHAKILDFGVARVAASDFRTRTGVMLGSPKYMAPEQVEGRPADHRSDIFSLGTVLYELVTGVAPFQGADLGSLMFDIARGTPVPPSHRNPLVPPALDRIIARALVKDPVWRTQDAGRMAHALARCAQALGADAMPDLLAVPGAPFDPDRTQPLDQEETWAWEKTLVDNADPTLRLDRADLPGAAVAAPAAGGWEQTMVAPPARGPAGGG